MPGSFCSVEQTNFLTITSLFCAFQDTVAILSAIQKSRLQQKKKQKVLPCLEVVMSVGERESY